MSLKYPGGFIMKNPTAPTTSAAKGVWTLDQVTGYVKQGIWPRSPGAPTIGTATAGAVGSGTATVTYTAPTDLGAGTVTYTATSSPGGLTGTGASPITVSGLTGGTAYTFTVTASTPGGTGPASAASNSVTPAALLVGDAYQGGFYAGQISTAGNGIADYNLVIGPVSSAQNASIKWKNANTATPGADSVINGIQNTIDMLADGSITTYPSAHFCWDLVVGGYTDWYMPAENELEICYYNLKPTTENNNTGFGTNQNSVPVRTSDYTTGNPAQTSATNFQSGGAEAFANVNYWVSTETGTKYGGCKNFNTGAFPLQYKNNDLRVRAIRRVAL